MNINLDLLGAVVRDIGSPTFGRAFFGTFNDAFAIRSCSVFAFRPSCEPRTLVAEGCTPDETELACALAVEYVNGGYHDDPNICGHRIARTPAVYSMRAAEIADAHYRQRFYERPHISYELVYLAAVGGVLYYLSFHRDERAGPFCAKDLITLRRLGRFAGPALQRHFELLGESTATENRRPRAAIRGHLDQAALLEHMREVFLETPCGLSQREAEVCAAIVLGYSVITISLTLNIAPNTVATHRKRAYRKLEVSSQSELFLRYFENVTQVQNAA